VVLQAEGLLLLERAVADGDAAVLLGVEVLGGDIGGPERGWVGGDAEVSQDGGQAFPAGRDELDQGVVEVEGDHGDGGSAAAGCG
jgi:hypothetical protein